MFKREKLTPRQKNRRAYIQHLADLFADQHQLQKRLPVVQNPDKIRLDFVHPTTGLLVTATFRCQNFKQQVEVQISHGNHTRWGTIPDQMVVQQNTMQDTAFLNAMLADLKV